MGKLFKLALEEAVVEEPSIVENVPVEEAVQNAEELAKTDSEIQQDIAAVEELMEEKAKLEDQAVTNDELLSNPDAVVTAADVEVSEETRTEVQYSLGYTSSMGKIRLSQESVFNDVKSNPRKYLAISNEDIKDTIGKITNKIKQIISNIIKKLDVYIDRVAFSFKSYEKAIENNFNFLSSVKAKPTKSIADETQRLLLDKNQAAINYTALGNVLLSGTFEDIDKILTKLQNNKQNAEASIVDDKIDLKSYGLAADMDDKHFVRRVYNTTGLASPKYGFGLQIVRLEQDLKSANLSLFNIDDVRVNVIRDYDKYKKAIKNAKIVFDKAMKIEKQGLKEIDKHAPEKDAGAEVVEMTKNLMNRFKEDLVVLIPFLIKEYIAAIKAYTIIGDELVHAYTAANGQEKMEQIKKNN